MTDDITDVTPKLPELPPEPAFPFGFHDHEGNLRWAQGMWLRDFFAASALKAKAGTTQNFVQLAEQCYLIADEMIKARAKAREVNGA